MNDADFFDDGSLSPEAFNAAVGESLVFGCKDLSIYSRRLLLRLVQVAQVRLYGAGGLGLNDVSVSPLGNVTLSLRIRDILPEGGTNYLAARHNIWELTHSPYVIKRPRKAGVPAGSRPSDYSYTASQILNRIVPHSSRGVIEVEVNSTTWRCLSDFALRIRPFDLEMALRLRKVSTIRLYGLLRNEVGQVSYSIGQLREKWGMDGRDSGTGRYLVYDDTHDFIRRTVGAAKDELDAIGFRTFDYSLGREEPEVSGHVSGRNRLTKVIFSPLYRVDTDLLAGICLN